MDTIERIFARYTQLRDNGVETTAALDLLRDHITPLSQDEKHRLARFIRALEAGEIKSPAAAPASPVFQPPPKTENKPLIRRISVQAEYVQCPRCNKRNPKHEMLCYSCGDFLHPSNSKQATRALLETNELFYSDEFFTSESVLSLNVRGATDIDMTHTYEIRPQDSKTELVIGRRADNSPVIPDIDLTEHHAEQRGVSRLHVTLRYDPQHNNLTVMDMGSANGTFLNGQRLHPNEVRTLRSGDELRLGKLVLSVTFYRLGWDDSELG